jgi:hypothetical protein
MRAPDDDQPKQFDDSYLLRQGWQRTHEHPYTNADGKLLFEKLRYERPDPNSPKGYEKRLFFRHRIGTNWYWSMGNSGERPLYHLQDIISAQPDQPVYVVESEKIVGKLAALNRIATCTATGWESADIEPLRSRPLIILADNDVNGTGEKKAADAVNVLAPLAASIRVVRGGPPRGNLADRIDDEITLEEFDELVGSVKEEDLEDLGNDELTPFAFTLAKDITLEPKRFLIDGFIGRHETSAWYGAPDVGKSAVKIHAACCVAAGVEYCGRRVEQGSVLYVAAERGAICRRRIKAWCKEQGVDDIPLAVVDMAIDLRSNKVDTARIIATARAIEETCGTPVVWIIFDTLNRVLAGGDENSSKDMGAVITAIDRIHRQTGAHCSVIHHVPQDRNDRMRGHGSVLGALDMTVRLMKQDGIVHVETDAAKDLVDKPRFAFTFTSVLLDIDLDTGVETTAPVVVPTTHIAKPTKPRKNLPRGAQIALRALREAIDEVGAVPEASNHIPPKIRVVSEEQWRQYAYARNISRGEERAKQAAFHRSSETLIAEQHVGFWNGQAWLAEERNDENRTQQVRPH